MSEDQELPMLTGAYALGAVDEVEAARFRQLLRASPEAAAEVRSFTETAALLGAAEAVEPPPGMRAAVLAQVRTTRQVPPVTTTSAGRVPRGSRWLAVAASALLVLTLGSGVAAWQFREDASEVAAANAAMTQVLTDPARKVLDADFAGGHATLVVSGDRVVVLGADVPAPPEGKGYQLWWMDGDRPIPSDMLSATGDGGYWADATGYESGQAMAVTIEPEGGSQKPTSDPVFVAET